MCSVCRHTAKGVGPGTEIQVSELAGGRVHRLSPWNQRWLSVIPTKSLPFRLAVASCHRISAPTSKTSNPGRIHQRVEDGMGVRTLWKAFQLMAVLTCPSKQPSPVHHHPTPPKWISGISAEPLGGAEGKTLFFRWRTWVSEQWGAT